MMPRNRESTQMIFTRAELCNNFNGMYAYSVGLRLNIDSAEMEKLMQRNLVAGHFSRGQWSNWALWTYGQTFEAGTAMTESP